MEPGICVLCRKATAEGCAVVVTMAGRGLGLLRRLMLCADCTRLVTGAFDGTAAVANMAVNMVGVPVAARKPQLRKMNDA